MQAARKIGVFVILAAMLAFIVLQFDLFTGPPKKANDRQQTAPSKEYEPKFFHEGDIVFLDSTKADTLLALPMEVASTPAEIQYGMMYRKSFSPNFYAMLFLMPDGDQMRSFWMRNTYVPLDIVYVNSNHEVVSIVQMAEPLNDQSLPSTAPAEFVVELPAGFTMKNGITAGAVVKWVEFE